MSLIDEIGVKVKTSFDSVKGFRVFLKKYFAILILILILLTEQPRKHHLIKVITKKQMRSVSSINLFLCLLTSIIKHIKGKINMDKWFWDDLDAEELEDEASLAKGVIEDALEDASLSDKKRQEVTDYYLEKLKSLYNEQRKRSLFNKD